MNLSDDPKTYQYDAFISYSHKDEAFAKRLESDLERYRPPQAITPHKRRLNIFRDVQDLVGNELSDAIKQALLHSKFLIVICSPHSRASEWVGKEIDEFMQQHEKGRIIPVLISGRPNHEVAPGEEHNQAFHETFYRYLSEPLAADFRTSGSAGLRDSREKKREAKFQVLAQLLNTSKEDLLKRQRRRTIQMLAAAAIVFFLMSVAFAWIALLAIQNAKEARRQLKISRSRELGAYATEEFNRKNSGLAVLLAIEASRIAETLTAYKILANYTGPLAIFSGHTARINHIAWSPDDKKIVSVGNDGTLRLWNTPYASSRKGLTLKAHAGKEIYHAAWNTDGSRVVTAGGDGTVQIWDPANGRRLLVIKAHQGPVNFAAWNTAGNRLITAGNDGAVRMWDAAAGKSLLEFKGHQHKVSYAAWNRKGNRIVSLGVRTARIWDSKTGEQVAANKFDLSSGYAEWNEEGTHLLTSLDNGEMKIWNAENDTVLKFQNSHYEDQPNDVAWNPDGSRLLTVSHDQTARIWDTRTGEELMRLSYAEATPIRCAAWNKSGKRFVTAGDDRAARIWDAATGTQIQAFEGYRSEIRQLAWNSKDTHLATVNDRQIIIQSTDINELLQAACKKVAKNMYGIDWERFFPGEGYRRTCPDLPPPEKYSPDAFLERKK
jgi:WD40 repeat protein